MARDRQRAKQRQQERRERRLAERGGRPAGSPPPEADGGNARPPARDDVVDEHEIEELADFEVGAPPQDLGFSERVIDHPAREPHLDADPIDEEELAEEAGAVGPARERQARRRAESQSHNRVIAFLQNVVAELGRVQWPDRKTLTQLTTVVLVFVVIMGAYLGALDAVFSALIKKIL